MHYAYCLSSEAGYDRAKESMDGIPIHALKALPKPTSSDKSRPCTMHERLRLIHSNWLLVEFGRFLEQFRITANACYYFPRCPTATSTEASELTAGKSQLPSSQCSRAKIRRISETAKRFCDFVRNKRKVAAKNIELTRWINRVNSFDRFS